MSHASLSTSPQQFNSQVKKPALKFLAFAFLRLKYNFLKVKKTDVMDNIFEIRQAIQICSVLAIFLFNKKCIVKPVDILTDFLIPQSPRDSQLTIPIVSYVYDKLLDGYNDLIYGHTCAIECDTKLHVTLYESGQKVKRLESVYRGAIVLCPFSFNSFIIIHI